MKEYNRNRFVKVTSRQGWVHCVLCGDSDWSGELRHTDDCPLRDPAVTSLSIAPTTGSVERWKQEICRSGRCHTPTCNCPAFQKGLDWDDLTVKDLLEECSLYRKANPWQRVTSGLGVFQYRMTQEQKKRIIDSFEAAGCSVHSPLAKTLGVLLEHCIRMDISFKLFRSRGGYLLRKVI